METTEIEGQYIPPEGWRMLQVGEVPQHDDQIVQLYIRRLKQQAEPEPQYTPPDGWRMLSLGETLRDGDAFIADGGEMWSARRIGKPVNNNRYIRLIEQPQPERIRVLCGVTVQVREGQWRTRCGQIRNVTPNPPEYLHQRRWFRQQSTDNSNVFQWYDAEHLQTWRNDGHYLNEPREHADDLIEYIGPIQAEPQQPQQPQQPQAELHPTKEYSMNNFLGCNIDSLGRTILITERKNRIPFDGSIDQETGEVIGTGTQTSKGKKVCQLYYLFTFSKRKSLSFFDSRDDNTEDLYPIDVYTNSSINGEIHWVIFVDEFGYEERFTISQLLEKSWQADPISHMFRTVLKMIMSVNGLRIDPTGRRHQKSS